MTNYFLVSNACRAAVYGIGTYLKQMTDFIKGGMPQYELSFIDIGSEEKELTIDKDENGIIHYRIPSFQSSNNVFLYYRSVIFLLNPYLDKEDKFILHFNYSLHYDLIRLFKEHYPNCKAIFTIHYMEWCFELNGDIERFRRIIHDDSCKDDSRKKVRDRYNKEKRVFSLCDKVLVLSNFTYKVVVDEYKVCKEKIQIVHNGICEIADGIERKGCHAEQTVNLLYVGRLDEAKGLGFAIQAFGKLYKRKKHVHFIIAGDGNFKEYLKLCHGFRKAVTFTGFIEHDEIASLLRESYIGVLPSFNEQCSYSALEMMAEGIPFISTDSTGMREMMERTPENMIHVNYGDFKMESFIDELSYKMEILINDKDLWEQSSKRLLSLFHERYSKERLYQSMTMALGSDFMSGECLSGDFLKYLDVGVVELIDTRPAIDMDYVGLTGIGCYLWWRIEKLKVQGYKMALSESLKLQEFLIYYIDWVIDVLVKDGEKAFTCLFEPAPLAWLLKNMKEANFYKTKVEQFIHLTCSMWDDIESEDVLCFDVQDIPWTALKVYNLYF